MIQQLTTNEIPTQKVLKWALYSYIGTYYIHLEGMEVMHKFI